MAPPILFPASTSPGKDEIEGGGRLINAYAERLGEGAPAQYVIRRTPGLTSFCATSETGFRGMWYDGNSYIYAAWAGELFYIDSAGTETSVGSLEGLRYSFLSSAEDNTDLTVYTYVAVALGTAHFNRRIIVAVLFDAVDDYPAASVTVGGIAATLVKGQTGPAEAVAIFIAVVPTGTTADIVVTYAGAANRSAIGVWRLDGATTNTAYATAGQGATTASGAWTWAQNIQMPTGGVQVGAMVSSTNVDYIVSGEQQDFERSLESGAIFFSGDSVSSATAVTSSHGAGGTGVTTYAAATATFGGPNGLADAVTFAKNNKAPTPDQVLVTPTLGAFTFTTSGVTLLDVNSEIPNSVTFGDGYFFFGTPGGLVYASGLNVTTVNSLDVMRVESKSEPLIRVLFFNGELYVWSATHCEVRASGGSPNLSGFPLNRTTVIWRGLVGIHAITGWEDGFHANLTWVADDDSVRMLVGYDPVQISSPDLERAIYAVPDKTAIRCWCYDVDGHASIVIDLGTVTWTYDLGEHAWHERKSATIDYWRPTGNSVKAFDKWIVGDHLSGNLYQVDPTAATDGGNTIRFEAESIAMEAFPQRLGIPRADFNFVTGVGDTTTRDPEVLISWSDDGGHTWSDPVTCKLGAAGRYFEQIRLNRVGLTGRKGRRWRVQVDDPVYPGLLAGSMEVAGRP